MNVQISHPTHNKACLAAAIKAAVENVRDEEGMTDSNFRAYAESPGFYDLGQNYLDEGLMTCRCHVGAIAHVKHRYETDGAQGATDLAASYLQCGYLSVDQYMQLVRWSEGRPSSV